MIRLLHIADVHLDTRLASKSDAVRDALREAIRGAFVRAIDCGLDESVDAVLIAGDLLDDDRLRLETEGFLLRQLDRLDAAGIPVVYATGNHDPGVSDSRSGELEWPSNVVRVADSHPEVFEFKARSGPFRIVAAGHASTREADNLVARFPSFDDGIPTIGVVHANVESVSTSGQHRPYAPCTVADLKGPGYEYWALGHVHAPGNVAGSNAWYAGCLQGRHFREAGPRGGLLVCLTSGRQPDVEFRAFAGVGWHEVLLPAVDSIEGSRELDAAAAGVIEPLVRDRAADRLAVRFRLEGETRRWREFRDADEVAKLCSRWRAEFDLLEVELDASRTYRPLDLASLREEPTVLAEAMRVVDDLVLDPDLLRRVLPVEVRARFGDDSALDVDDAEQLHRLLAERFVLPE